MSSDIPPRHPMSRRRFDERHPHAADVAIHPTAFRLDFEVPEHGNVYQIRGSVATGLPSAPPRRRPLPRPPWPDAVPYVVRAMLLAFNCKRRIARRRGGVA